MGVCPVSPNCSFGSSSTCSGRVKEKPPSVLFLKTTLCCPVKSPHPYFLPSAKTSTLPFTATIPGIRNAFCVNVIMAKWNGSVAMRSKLTYSFNDSLKGEGRTATHRHQYLVAAFSQRKHSRGGQNRSRMLPALYPDAEDRG